MRVSQVKPEQNEDLSIKSEEEKKEICLISDTLPNKLFKNHDVLHKWGGGQRRNGSLVLLGEFLVPEGIHVIRTMFKIKNNSFIYISANPTHKEKTNIDVSLTLERKTIFSFFRRFSPTYGHNEITGITFSRLNKSKWPFLVELSFENTDKENLSNNCRTYEIAMSIVPEKTFSQKNVSCDITDKVVLPEVITLNTQGEEVWESYFNIDSKLNKMVKNLDGNYEHIIKINNEKAHAFTVILKYGLIDNMVDMMIEEENYGVYTILKNTDDPKLLSISNENEELIMTKKIEVKLHKGTYNLKLVLKNSFISQIASAFSEKINSMCFAFILQYESANLNLKSDDKVVKNDMNDITNVDIDEDDNSSVIQNIEKADLKDSSINKVISVEPMSQKNIRSHKSTKIEVLFELPIDELLSSGQENLNKIAYLENSKSSNERIYPEVAIEEESHRLVFEFKNKKLQKQTCYDLKFNFDVARTTAKYRDDELKHEYCTEFCECNPKSIYKCKNNGRCACKWPYTGDKCYECDLGFKKIDNSCIDINNLKCTDDTTCNKHGKCLTVPEGEDLKCECEPGFTNNGDDLCSVCIDSSLMFPNCNEEDNMKGDDGEEGETDSFGWKSVCGLDSPKLPKKLFDRSDVDLKTHGGVQDNDGSIDFQSILEIKNTDETVRFKVYYPSLIRVFFVSRSFNRAKVSLLKSIRDTQEGFEVPLASTEGMHENESFIAKLEPRSKSYYIKINHLEVPQYSVCIKYQIKIVILPIKLANKYLIRKVCLSFTT